MRKVGREERGGVEGAQEARREDKSRRGDETEGEEGEEKLTISGKWRHLFTKKQTSCFHQLIKKNLQLCEVTEQNNLLVIHPEPTGRLNATTRGHLFPVRDFNFPRWGRRKVKKDDPPSSRVAGNVKLSVYGVATLD